MSRITFKSELSKPAYYYCDACIFNQPKCMEGGGRMAQRAAAIRETKCNCRRGAHGYYTKRSGYMMRRCRSCSHFGPGHLQALTCKACNNGSKYEVISAGPSKDVIVGGGRSCGKSYSQFGEMMKNRAESEMITFDNRFIENTIKNMDKSYFTPEMMKTFWVDEVAKHTEPLKKEPDAICPMCMGEGKIETERCTGDCYHGPNKACNGMDEGECDEGVLTPECPECNGEGSIPLKTLGMPKMNAITKPNNCKVIHVHEPNSMQGLVKRKRKSMDINSDEFENKFIKR